MSSGLPAGPLILITLPSNHYNTKLWRQSYLFEYSGSVMLVVWLIISDDIIFPLWSRKIFTTDEAYGKRHDVTYSHRVIVWISIKEEAMNEFETIKSFSDVYPRIFLDLIDGVEHVYLLSIQWNDSKGVNFHTLLVFSPFKEWKMLVILIYRLYHFMGMAWVW